MGRGRRGNVKEIQMGDSSNSAELSDMFNQLIDPTKVDVEIVYPKYIKIIDAIRVVLLTLAQIVRSPMIKMFPEIDAENISLIVTKMTDCLESSIYTKDMIVENYSAFKESYVIQECIMICSCLAPYKDYIGDSANLSDKFIKSMNSGTKIINFTNIDLAIMWAKPCATASIKNFMLNWMHILYINTYNIYQTIISPDVDVDRLSEVLIEAITNIEKHPELNRCKKAFSKLKNSVELLKGNFSEYYRDFLQSKNPTIIIESFISDVSRQEHADTEVIYQFKKIISFYRKAANSNHQKLDPNVFKLLDMLDDKTRIIEKGIKPNINQEHIEDTDGTSSEVPELVGNGTSSEVETVTKKAPKKNKSKKVYK